MLLVFHLCCYTWTNSQVSVYRTIGPTLVSLCSHVLFLLSSIIGTKVLSPEPYLRIKSLFFNLHDVMKTVVVAKILHEALHHIMKVEK